jgi:hypothetical protein
MLGYMSVTGIGSWRMGWSSGCRKEEWRILGKDKILNKSLDAGLGSYRQSDVPVAWKQQGRYRRESAEDAYQMHSMRPY